MAGQSPFIQTGLLVLGLLVIVALIADLVAIQKPRPAVDVKSELQDLLIGLNGPRFIDPNGRFSVVPPADWQIKRRPDCPPYDVVFRGPYATEICIMATPVQYDDLPSLLKDMDRAEQQFDIHTQKEPMFFQAKPVRRVVRMNHADVFSLDFVSDRVAHHIYCTVPAGEFEAYYSAIVELLNTYRFGAAMAATNPAPKGAP